MNHAPYDAHVLQESDLQLRFSKWAPFRTRNVAHSFVRRCQADPAPASFCMLQLWHWICTPMAVMWTACRRARFGEAPFNSKPARW